MGWLMACVFLAAPAFAESTVQAELSTGTAEVGEPVELKIVAQGKSQATLLDGLNVDGLETHGNQQQFQMQMSFPGGVEVTTSHTITFTATRPGEFSIPPLRVRLDGKEFRTPASVLRVTPSTGPQVPRLPAPPAAPAPQGRGGARPQHAESDAQPTFGELLVPKTSAYVGEVIPVDLRFGVVAAYPAQFSERPNFGGEGFTVQSMSRPVQIERERNGVEYTALVYHAALTAAKAGPLEIPPASVQARIQVPVQTPHGNDFFGGLMRDFGMTDVRDIEIKTDTATVEVKPLPKEGRPESFAGAVGEDFRIETSASPKSAASGEPIVLKVVVSGRGNFEAMGPPVLSGAEGWRVYDPSESFEPSPSDPIGFNGRKIYEFTMIAREDQKATPSVKFSYFDTGSEKFATLEGAPVPVNAKGSAQATPPPPATQTQPPSQTNASPSQPTPAPKAAAPHPELSRDMRPGSFRPAAWHPAFLLAGAVFGTLWLLGFGMFLLRRYSQSERAARTRLAAKRRQALRDLSAPRLSEADFLAQAAAFLESLPTLQRDQLPADLQDIFARHEQSVYSTRKPQPISHETRLRMIEALNTFCHETL